MDIRSIMKSVGMAFKRLRVRCLCPGGASVVIEDVGDAEGTVNIKDVVNG